MTRDEVIRLLVAILGAGGVGAIGSFILAWRKDKRQGPIERKTAEQAEVLSHVDTADKLLLRAMEMSRMADEKAERAQKEARQAKESAANVAQRATALEAQVEMLRRALDAAQRYIHILTIEWRANLPGVPIPEPPPEYEEHI